MKRKLYRNKIQFQEVNVEIKPDDVEIFEGDLILRLRYGNYVPYIDNVLHYIQNQEFP